MGTISALMRQASSRNHRGNDRIACATKLPRKCKDLAGGRRPPARYWSRSGRLASRSVASATTCRPAPWRWTWRTARPRKASSTGRVRTASAPFDKNQSASRTTGTFRPRPASIAIPTLTLS